MMFLKRVKEILKRNIYVYEFSMRIIEGINRFRYVHAKEKGIKALVKLISTDYKKKTGDELRIPPISYTEKMQFAKLFDSTRTKGELADKYSVRTWVRNTIGENYLIPLLGVWDRFENIDFRKLPNQFVLKTNHGSATNLIVKDKNSIDFKKAAKQFDFWLKEDFAFSGRGYELHYSFIEPKIIAEKYIADKSGNLNDYKFLCFEGRPCFCWVDLGRFSKHRRYVFDMEWNLQPWSQYTYEDLNETIDKPTNFEEMVEVVNALCKGFSQVRVDLYNVDGKVYFGEMTFTNGKGYELISPPEYNDKLGEMWKQDFSEYCV